MCVSTNFLLDDTEGVFECVGRVYTSIECTKCFDFPLFYVSFFCNSRPVSTFFYIKCVASWCTRGCVTACVSYVVYVFLYCFPRDFLRILASLE